MENGKNNQNEPSFKNGALILSEFSYLFIIIIMIIFGLLFPFHNKSVKYYSKTNVEG